jgi:hypothetical protein
MIGYEYDCLGCLNDALCTGDITQEEYDEITGFANELSQMQTTPCQTCPGTAYISMFEPDLAHCPECGMYMQFEVLDQEWQPLRQGTAFPERVRTP